MLDRPVVSAPARPGRGLLIGLVAVLALTAVKFAFWSVIGGPTPFLLYFGAVLLSAWFGGPIPALVTSVVAALIGNVAFLGPLFGPSLSPAALVQTGLFLAECVFIVGATGVLHERDARVRLDHQWFKTVLRNISDEEQHREERKTVLMRATSELTSSLDYEANLRTVAASAVPAIADYCAIDLVNDGELQRLAIASTTDDDYDTESNVAAVMRTGEPHLSHDAWASSMSVPIKRAGPIVGVISLAIAASRRRYDDGDLRVARALGERAAIAIENTSLVREAERLRTQAERASRSKDEFLAMLGHELRNPLAPILTALQLMSLRAGDTLQHERDVIERQVKHVVRLVDDLLDVSRITRGKVELAREVVEISEIVSKSIEMSRPLVEQREHDLSTDIEASLYVDGDPMRLAQILANLINNAAKYTEKGGHIRIRASSAGGTAVIRVRDDGIGIEPEMLPRVFDLFVQEGQALDRAQGGLGIGLAIVRSLVLLHGGTVEARSEGNGKGSEFVVRLPLATRPRPQLTTPPPLVRSHAGERILVVDDNADALDLLASSLEHLGYTTLRAVDGPSALTVASQERPQIALLDIGLPVMDGYELARRLRELEGLEHMKLVAITGYGQPSDRKRSAEAGFDAHLVKPVSIKAVQDAIEAEDPSRAPA